MQTHTAFCSFPTLPLFSLTWLLTASLVACGPPQGSRAASLTATTAAPVESRVRTTEVAVAGNADTNTERALAAVSGDPNPAQRRAAIDQVANGSSETEPLLRSLASDHDPLVRRWAALALERRARRDHGPALRQALASERDPAIENILQRALARAEQGS